MARLAFFGTPDLAATCLRALLAQKRHELALVVCQPDRPQGRGQRLESPPTKKLAIEHNLAVLQPATLKKGTSDGDIFFDRFAAVGVDLAIVAAYGRIVPKRLLDLPPRAFVNVHASLLPRWRGAAPIQRAIEAGDARTGVCLMHMVPELDAGDVYARAEVAIADDDDGATLTDKVADLGGRILLEHLDALVAGSISPIPQGEKGLTYAAMLKKDEGRINWSRPAKDVVNHARAMIPWPGAWTTLGGETLKLFSPSVDRSITGSGPPGTVLSTSGALVVACADGAAAFLDAQLPNKKRMPVVDLLRGRPIPLGTRLVGEGDADEGGHP